jgi:cytochrome b involved in lipid metabolism
MPKKKGVLTNYIERRSNAAKRKATTKKVEGGKGKKEIGRGISNAMKKSDMKEKGELSDDKEVDKVDEVVSSSKVEVRSKHEYAVASATTSTDVVSGCFPLVGI